VDREQYLHRRKAKYMAQTLEEFENKIEPLLPDTEAAREVRDSFKGLVRGRFNGLAVDGCELLKLDGVSEINGVAQAFRDQLSPVGRP
jgi:hypothetical protein